MNCTIEAKVLPLAGGLSGHLYLEVFDDCGKRIAQINGFATDKATGQTKAVGFPGDLLKAHVSETHILASTAECAREEHVHRGIVLFRGTAEDILRALAAAQKRASEINAQDLPYKLLSFNSNTVFMEMVRAIGGAVAIDWEAVESVGMLKLSFPGLSTDFNKAVEVFRQEKNAPKGKRPSPPSA